MALKPKPKTCFNCGQTAKASIQSKQIRRTHFICREKKCWDTYHRLCDEAQKEAG